MHQILRAALAGLIGAFFQSAAFFPSAFAADPPAAAARPNVLIVPAGRTKLRAAWFQDGSRADLCGAFFVTVRRK